MLFLCLTKGPGNFVTSDFPAENPRTQNRYGQFDKAIVVWINQKRLETGVGERIKNNKYYENNQTSIN